MDARVCHERHDRTLQGNHDLKFCDDDANVTLNAPLLKTIIKRYWTGKDGNMNRPSLIHAMDGLSPFTMLDLSEDEVAMLNNEDYLITSASLVSVDNLSKKRKKRKYEFPLK